MEVRFVDEMPFGFSWIALQKGFMRRTSHALAVDGLVWVVEPTTGDGVVERIRALGEPAGVLVLFGRHRRDSAALARELGVPRYAAPFERPPGAPFELVPLGHGELALWLREQRTLVVAEAVGTVQFMRAPAERLGLHPARRLTPPRALLAYEPEHLLVGHGEGLHGPDAAAALRDTLEQGRGRAASYLWSGVRAHVLRRR